MNGKRKRSLASWSDLPNELLNQVLTHLKLSDYLSFRLVCAAWREAAKQLTECINSPLLMLSYYKNHQSRCCFVCPFKGSWYKINQLEFHIKYECLGSFHGWLLMITKDSRDTIFFINPYTRVRIYLPHWNRNEHIYKVAVSSAPTDSDCTIIVLMDFSSFRFCRVGGDEWTREISPWRLLDAFVFRGKFYLLHSQKPLATSSYAPAAAAAATTNATTLLNLEYWGLNQVPHYSCRVYDAPCLVESNGEVLLVVKRYSRSMGSVIRAYNFIVFKMDLLTSTWIKINKIGNQVLFLGRCRSVSFAATELGCRENQICFIEPKSPGDGWCWWVFNMEDGSIKKGPISSYRSLNGVRIFEEVPVCITPSFV